MIPAVILSLVFAALVLVIGKDYFAWLERDE